MSQIYDFTVKTSDQKEKSLADYKDQILLIVNTASKCGFTNQYQGLQELYNKYKDQGVSILAFPCNQFGSQEPGDQNEILEFCSLNYQVTFPIFHKIDVNGDDADPLYVFLKKEAPGLLGSKSIKWNFTKFLVDRQGNVVDRYASTQTPKDLEKEIEKILALDIKKD